MGVNGGSAGGGWDGPALVVDDQERGLFLVHRSVFTDPGVLALERERIFDRCWLYAGHESEIPEVGDFVTRRVAGRPIIVTRGRDGKVRVLLNTCTHRGAWSAASREATPRCTSASTTVGALRRRER